MPNGTVKKWVDEKGFGFLLPDGGGNDVFVHRSVLVGTPNLAPGDRVTFDAQDDGKGRGKFKACNVAITTAAVSSSSTGGLFADLPAATDLGESRFGAGMDAFLEVLGDTGSMLATIEPFIVKSSLGCPFLIVSEGQLISHVRAPLPNEFTQIISLVNACVTACETCEATMIVDFEGELSGHGGELTVAQLQVTSTVDSRTLMPRPIPEGPPCTLGLLLDLRTAPCIAVIRQVVESAHITKLMWGAAGDVESLMYQEQPTVFQFRPVCIVDVQKAFNGLGLCNMLVHVPQRLQLGLPKKEQIDFDAFHAQNRRALVLPLSFRSAAYAMDDLHRIEAVLRSKVPPGGSYVEASRATDQMVAETRADPLGLQTLGRKMGWFETSSGVKRTVKAVEIQRHIISLRARGVDIGPEQAFVDQIEAEVAAELRKAGVDVRIDLSFVSDAPSPSKWESVASLPWQ